MSDLLSLSMLRRGLLVAVAPLLFYTTSAYGQCGTGGTLIWNPLASFGLGGWDCTGAGGGLGTVTSVGLAGTANQITVTGATPITGSGSWTLSLPAAVTFPGDATVTGTFLVGTSLSVDASTGIATTSKIGNAALSLLSGAGKFTAGVPIGQAACADLSDGGTGCSATIANYATLASPTFTGGITLSSAPLTMSGNISAAAWTTSGLRIKGVAATFTDTSSSGTVAAAYTDVFGGNTIAASSATTFTNYYTAYFKDPVQGSNVTLTNKFALGADSGSIATLKATTFNGNTFTTGTGVLTIAAAKTLTANSTLTLAGTDGITMTTPTTSFTAARTDAANTFTGVQTMTSPALTTPAITTSATLSNNGIAAVSTDGFVLQNTTAAINGTQQWSPRLHFIGHGFKSTGSVDQTDDWIAEQQTIQGSANSTTNLVFSEQIAGGGYSQILVLGSSNTLQSLSPTGVAYAQNFATSGGVFTSDAGTNTLIRTSSAHSISIGDNQAQTININSSTGVTNLLGSGGIALTPTITKYNNVATAGMGTPPIYASAALTAQTATIAATNLQCGGAVCPAGTYRVIVYTVITSTGTGTLTSTIGWTDPGQAQSITSAGVAATAKNFEQVEYRVRADGIANITYATTRSVADGAYAIYVTLERLQ